MLKKYCLEKREKIRKKNRLIKNRSTHGHTDENNGGRLKYFLTYVKTESTIAPK